MISLFKKAPILFPGLLIFFISLIPRAFAIDWPVWPDSSTHYIGRTYGTYQQPDYMHHGLDILVPAGTPVYAVESGYVKCILTTYMEKHWRIAIGDSAGNVPCEAWLYAHIDDGTIPVTVGQYVEKGDYLGDIISWTPSIFDHLHIVKIFDSLAFWYNWTQWEYIANPLDVLEPLNDPDAPVFVNAIENQIFAFCRNSSADYFPNNAELNGDVDIICHVYDIYNADEWKNAPYSIEYKIIGDS